MHPGQAHLKITHHQGKKDPHTASEVSRLGGVKSGVQHYSRRAHIHVGYTRMVGESECGSFQR